MDISQYLHLPYSTETAFEIKNKFPHSDFRIWFSNSIFPALYSATRLNLVLDENMNIDDIYMG